MFTHRRKTIGKSLYFISELPRSYVVKEIYNGTQVGKSKYTHRRIDDAIHELDGISRERHFTDSSATIII